MSFWSWLTGSGARQPAGVSSPWSSTENWQAIVAADLFGSEPVPITREVAMRIPAVARSRNVLCAVAMTLPLVAQTADGPRDPQPDICRVIDRYRPYSITIAWIIDQLLFNGVAWLVVQSRAYDGSIQSARVALPSELKFNPDGWPVAYQNKAYAATDFIQIPCWHEGVLNFGKVAFRQATNLAESAGRAADNPIPSIELHQTNDLTLTDDKIQKLVDSWRSARRGKNGGVAYTPKMIQTIAHGEAAEQLLIEGRKASDVDMARVMGVPAWVIDAPTSGSTLTYSNIESRTRELLAYGLTPYLTVIEDRLSMDDILPRGVWTSFDTTQALAGDLKTRAEAYQAAEAAGIMTAEQALAQERGTTQLGDHDE